MIIFPSNEQCDKDFLPCTKLASVRKKRLGFLLCRAKKELVLHLLKASGFQLPFISIKYLLRQIVRKT